MSRERLLLILAILLLVLVGLLGPMFDADPSVPALDDAEAQAAVERPTDVPGVDISEAAQRLRLDREREDTPEAAAVSERRLTIEVVGAHGCPALPVRVHFADAAANTIVESVVYVDGSCQERIPSGAVLARVATIGDLRASAECLADRDAHVTLRIKDMVVFSGRVVDEKGRALLTASVEVLVARGQGLLRVARVDGAGEFRLALPAPAMITATAPGYCPSRGTVITRRHNGERFTMQCEAASVSIQVNVRDPAGNPIEGARAIAGPRFSETIYDPVRVEEYWIAGHAEALTDADGSCSLWGAWGGQRVRVAVLAQGYTPRYADVPLFDERTGIINSAEVDVIVGEGVDVRGVVEDVAGEPVAGVRVWMNGGEWGERWCRTDASGRFAFQGCDRENPGVILVDSPRWQRTEMPATTDSEMSVRLTRKR